MHHFIIPSEDFTSQLTFLSNRYLTEHLVGALDVVLVTAMDNRLAGGETPPRIDSSPLLCKL